MKNIARGFAKHPESLDYHFAELAQSLTKGLVSTRDRHVEGLGESNEEEIASLLFDCVYPERTPRVAEGVVEGLAMTEKTRRPERNRRMSEIEG